MTYLCHGVQQNSESKYSGYYYVTQAACGGGRDSDRGAKFFYQLENCRGVGGA